MKRPRPIRAFVRDVLVNAGLGVALVLGFLGFGWLGLAGLFGADDRPARDDAA